MKPGGAANSTEPAWRRRGRVVLALAVVGHVVFGLLRIPHAVIAQRWADVDAFRREGDAAWLLRTARLNGADAIALVRECTGPDAVIAIRGAHEDALEWAPPLLWPRLCCAERALPAGATTFAGRRIADLVLVGDEKTLRVEPR